MSAHLKILNRINPNLIWYLYAEKCKKLFNESKLILSFDCDTEEDIVVVWDVHSRLLDMGITPVYAVPGELLKKGEKIYRKIHETGAEFINHGGREHTYFDTANNRHASCFFYDQQPLGIVEQDIIQGHKTLQDVLGITATCWRTPHFGTFQKSEHLIFLYSILKEMNYKFSTSTSPEMAYRYGPIYKHDSIFEMPVTGIFSEPLNIMDTWGYFEAHDRFRAPDDYVKTSQSLAKFSSCHPIFINIYGDPSHIYDKPEFFQAMKILVQASENMNYTQLLGMIDENLRLL
jgi:hypothetical protein